MVITRNMKKVEENEADTVIVQRRSICCKENFPLGHRLSLDDLIYLRPCPISAFKPSDVQQVIGKKLRVAKIKGDVIYPSELEQ